jgi:hypothetical protein
MRRGAGAVERGGLENRCALTGTEGSNPSLSANPPAKLAGAASEADYKPIICRRKRRTPSARL